MSYPYYRSAREQLDDDLQGEDSLKYLTKISVIDSSMVWFQDVLTKMAIHESLGPGQEKDQALQKLYVAAENYEAKMQEMRNYLLCFGKP